MNFLKNCQTNVSMKNRNIRRLFYELCNCYTPSIFIDEIWEYFMSTVGKYIGSDKIYNDFYDFVNINYNGDTYKLEKDIENLGNDLINYIDNSYSQQNQTLIETDYECLSFTNLEDGFYLTFDLKNAFIQVLLYYNIITLDCLSEIFEKHSNGHILKKYKWFYRYVYQRSNLRQKIYSFYKSLIKETINVDPFFKKYINKENNYLIIGDRLFLPIEKKEIELFKDIVNKEYKTVNNVLFFVDICEKITLTQGIITPIHIDNSFYSRKKFYSHNSLIKECSDICPQIYKKIIKEPITEMDLLYGYDDMISSFKNKIWED